MLMQVFQKQRFGARRVDEAVAVLKVGAGRCGPDGEFPPGWDELDGPGAARGRPIEPRETVMTIEGDYSLFAHLETVYLGCLARRTLVMRNVARRRRRRARQADPVLPGPP